MSFFGSPQFLADGGCFAQIGAHIGKRLVKTDEYDAANDCSRRQPLESLLRIVRKMRHRRHNKLKCKGA